MPFFTITIERFLEYQAQTEAANQQEAERLGRELLPALTADHDSVIVQARQLEIA